MKPLCVFLCVPIYVQPSLSAIWPTAMTHSWDRIKLQTPWFIHLFTLSFISLCIYCIQSTCGGCTWCDTISPSWRGAWASLGVARLSARAATQARRVYRPLGRPQPEDIVHFCGIGPRLNTLKMITKFLTKILIHFLSKTFTTDIKKPE